MTRFIADSCSDMLQMEGVDFVAVPLTISTDVKDYHVQPVPEWKAG